jgi:hypothetical protein
MSRDRAVGKVTRLWAVGSRNHGSISSTGKNFLSSPTCPLCLRPAHPPIQQVARGLSQGAMGPVREANYTPLCSAEVTNTLTLLPLHHTHTDYCSYQ